MTRLTPFAARNRATDDVAHNILHERDLDARAKFQHCFAAEIAARADALLAEDEDSDEPMVPNYADLFGNLCRPVSASRDAGAIV